MRLALIKYRLASPENVQAVAEKGAIVINELACRELNIGCPSKVAAPEKQ